MHEFELAADIVIAESLRKYPPQQVLHQASFVYANTDSESTTKEDFLRRRLRGKLVCK